MANRQPPTPAAGPTIRTVPAAKYPDSYPRTCRRGHQLGPGRVHVGWLHCGCPGATNGGHQYLDCMHGFTATTPACGDRHYLTGHHTGPIEEQR
jgi:hypothetical protein